MTLILTDYIQIQQEIGARGYPIVKIAITDEQAEKLAEQIMEKLK